MTYGVASRYANIFRILGDPYALVILDEMYENDKEYTTEELAKIANTTEGKVRSILNQLLDYGIVDKDYDGGEDKYEVTDNNYANFVEAVIERID